MDTLEYLYESGQIPEECLFELSDGRAEDDNIELVSVYENQSEYERHQDG